MSAAHTRRLGEHLTVETRPLDPGGTRIELVVDRRRRLNALDSKLMSALRDALTSAAEHPDARVVVLRGAGGKAWIGGADINEMGALQPGSARRFIEGLHALCTDLRALPLPVVAAIDGYCLGAGLEIAACCDLRIASARASFAMPEVRLGIPSVIDAALLPRIIGAGRARDLVLTGRSIDANEAYRIGLIDALTIPEALESLVDQRVSELAAATAAALATQKSLCRAWDEIPYTQAIERSIDAFDQAFQSDEPTQRMREFMSRKR